MIEISFDCIIFPIFFCGVVLFSLRWIRIYKTKNLRLDYSFGNSREEGQSLVQNPAIFSLERLRI